MKTAILGCGLAGLSLAHFLNDDSVILEKEKQTGGLCRSFSLNGIFYDIGPHVIFSRNNEALDILTSLAPMNRIRRSNRIFHNGRMVKYPFENDLAALSVKDRDYCVKMFLDNPYENSKATNMLQFFLKTFGEGMTNIYLKPYNEKIWKFDISKMDMQMVERIPKPPKGDVLKSAKGTPTEGYKHQLYFHYPVNGGINSLVKSYEKSVSAKSEIVCNARIKKICKVKNGWVIKTGSGDFHAERLVNCMPLHELFKYIVAPRKVKNAVNALKYNSIYIITLQAKGDYIGDNFAINFPDREIIFHRISKLNFLGKCYAKKNMTTIMAEVTYRKGTPLARMKPEDIKKAVIGDLDMLGFVKKKDIVSMEFHDFKYAYVIYDLCHRKNTDLVLNYLKARGIYCCGRFAEFEYLNMDSIIWHSLKLAEKMNGEKDEEKD